MRLLAIALGLIVIGLLAFSIFDSTFDTAARITTIGVVLFLLALSIPLLRDPDHTTVTTQYDSIQIGRQPPVPWSQIDRVRHRELARRLELFAGGTRVGSIHCHLEGIEDLVPEIVAKATLAIPDECEFVMPHKLLNTIATVALMLLFAGASVWLWMTGEGWFYLVCAGILLAMLAYELCTELVSVAITNPAIALRTLTTSKSFSRGTLRDVQLVIENGEIVVIRCALVFTNGSVETFRIRGVNSIDVYLAMRAAYPELIR